jgi:heme-binding protein
LSIAKRSVQLGVLAATAMAATAAVALPSAGADPADPCTAVNLTETISKVNHDISQYLQAHPDVNQALSEVPKQSPFSAQSAFTAYFDGNKQAATDLHNLQQPLVDLSNQCGYQVTPGQVMGALSDL